MKGIICNSFFFWSTLVRISLTKALGCGDVDNKSDLISVTKEPNNGNTSEQHEGCYMVIVVIRTHDIDISRYV